MTRWGLSYGGEFARYGPYDFYGIDEMIENPPKNRVRIFAELKIFGGMVARVEARELPDTDRGRIRSLFDDGIAGGMLGSREFRTRKEGRRYLLSGRGVF